MRGGKQDVQSTIWPCMNISAIQKLTLLDFPDHVACIVFTPGCNFRCGYCHNPEFVLPESLQKLRKSFLTTSSAFAFLKERKGKLDGVVISGGEPTLQRGLADFLRGIKEMGFKTKLDTNGSLPEILRPLFKERLVDYVAMDIKTSLARYQELASACVRPEAIRESITLIKEQAPDYEFRTTVVKEHHDEGTLQDMRELIDGSRRYVLQGFRPGKTLHPAYEKCTKVSDQDLVRMSRTFSQAAETILIRT